MIIKTKKGYSYKIDLQDIRYYFWDEDFFVGQGEFNNNIKTLAKQLNFTDFTFKPQDFKMFYEGKEVVFEHIHFIDRVKLNDFMVYNINIVKECQLDYLKKELYKDLKEQLTSELLKKLRIEMKNEIKIKLSERIDVMVSELQQLKQSL